MIAELKKYGEHWVIAIPIFALAIAMLEEAHLISPVAPLFLFAASILLIATVFAAVHHAETLSHRVGQPFGSILLALAVTVIEAALIVSMMVSPSEGDPTVARDAVFSAIMIVLNGIVGLCLLIGGVMHREQSFHAHGAVAAFSVLVTLATLTLILPNFTLATPGPYYSPVQLAFVAVVALTLYGVFLFVQTVRHRTDFLDISDDTASASRSVPTNRETAVSALFLLVALLTVVLLAETLAPTVEGAVFSLGLAEAFVGFIIASVVLLPEGVTAFRAAFANRLQTSLNVATGSALASVGLSIPAIVAASFWLGQPVTLGLEQEHIVLLGLSFFVGMLTLATGRTTILQGAVHLVIFACFVLLAAVP